MELTQTYQRIITTDVYLDGAKVGEIRTYAKYTSQSIANDETYWMAKQTFWYNQPSKYYYAVSSATATLDGTPKPYKQYTRFYGGETLIQEVSRTTKHSEDGTSPSRFIETKWKDSVGHDLSGSTYITFPKIDRYPYIISAPDFNDEANPKVDYSTVNGFPSSTVQIGILDNSDNVLVSYRDVVLEDGTYTFELTNTERNTLRQYTTGKTSTVKFSLKTTASGTSYYSKVSKTLTIINANPTFNVAYQDTNATTTAITNNNQQIIQNNSTLQINITNATGLKYATVSSVSVNINGAITTDTISSATKNINIGTLNLSSNTNATITLTDSRGNTTTQTIELTILEWQLPTAIITLARKQNFYTVTDITVDANYSSLDSKNTITIQYRYKKTTDGSYGAWNNLSDNVQSTFNIDNQYAWNVEVKLTDRLGSTTYSNLYVGVGIPPFFIDKHRNSVGVWCFPNYDKSVEVDGIDISNTYDENERPVGRWIDGSIIYRKVFSSNGVNGNNVNIAHGITNLGKVIKIDASAKGSEARQYPLNNTSFTLQVVEINGTNVKMNISTSFGTGWVIHYIMEYTKL